MPIKPAPTAKRKLKLRNRFMRAQEYRAFVTFALGVLTLIFSSIGIYLHMKTRTEPISTLSYIGLFIGELASSFVPSSAPFAEGAEKRDATYMIGRFLGMLTTASGVVLIGMASFGRSVAAMWTRMFRRDHTIIIGDTALARRLANAFEDRDEYVIQFVPETAPELPGARAVREHVGYGVPAMVRIGGMSRAKRIIIDAGGDAETIAISKPLYVALSQLPKCQIASIALRISDSVLADAVSETVMKFAKTLPRPLLFDENRMVAQDTLAKLPPFRIASAMKQKRVHALVFGFGDLGEKLLDQVMLTSVAGGLDAPMVTVVDRDAERRAQEFRASRPAVMDTLDVEMITLNLGHQPLDDGHPPAGLKQLLARSKKYPVTAIYLALPTAAETLRALLLLRRLREREGLLKAPVFYRSRAEDGEADILALAWSEDKPDEGCISMGFTDEALVEEIAEPEKRFALARHVHDIYRKGGAVKPAADVDWEVLSETYRRANMRAADHLPAKLWTLGISGPPFSDEAKARLKALISAGGTHPDVVKMAQLEHERWMIERKLDGWRFSRVRNDVRRLHDKLVPWAELKKQPEEVAKDVEQILAALSFVVGKDS